MEIQSIKAKYMKIIGGIFKNRNFYMPAGIRPTQNLVRGAVFDVIGKEIKGASLVDIFAGSGAVGLEALSRGAESVLCVERERKNVDIIKENLGILKKDKDSEVGVLEVWHKDAFSSIKSLAGSGRLFDMIFIDPPYGRQLAKKALKTLDAYGIFHSNSRIIIQHESNEILPETSGRIHCFRKKKYGESTLSFYQSLDS
jgi:16S rRNA (guanine966-N2)-methyltransferase